MERDIVRTVPIDMGTASLDTPDRCVGDRSGSDTATAGRPSSAARRRASWLESLGGFWVKINNDWIFNLAGLLAYNFLMAMFPVLLLLLAACGIVLQVISPGAEGELERAHGGGAAGGYGQYIGSERSRTPQEERGIAARDWHRHGVSRRLAALCHA